MDINVLELFGKTYSAPNSWNDLTLKQKFVCHDVLMSLPREDEAATFGMVITFTQKRIALMQFLLNLSDLDLRSWQIDTNDNDIFAEELKTVTETVTDFLFEKRETTEGAVQFGISATMTACPYPTAVLKSKKTGKEVKLWAASDGLSNISFAEMAYIFTCFEQYNTTGSEEWINRALAVVYRPSKPNDSANKKRGFDGDRRVALEESDEVIEKRMKLWARVPQDFKRLLWFWLVSCREQIIRENPQVFKSGNSDALMKRLAVYSWAGVAIELAKGDVLARKAIETSNYKDIFITLSYLETKSEVSEAMAKRITN